MSLIYTTSHACNSSMLGETLKVTDAMTGIAFATERIREHFSESKILLLLFISQIFLYGLGPCPRHRVPNLIPTTGL
ncbi:hypothetical protein ABKN59_006065 [Abortiporus biennis]